MLTRLVQSVFGDRVTDRLSGYRVFSRRFVKSFPALASGFKTETSSPSTPSPCACRSVRSPSPTAVERVAAQAAHPRDGLRILRSIVVLVKDERLLPFFATCALVLFATGVGLSVPVVIEFWRNGLVPRLPAAVLSTGLVVLSFLSLFSGLILDSVAGGEPR